MHEDTHQRGLLFDFPPRDRGVFCTKFCPISMIMFSALWIEDLWMMSVMKVKMSSRSFSQPEKLLNISPSPAIVVTVTASGLL